MAIWNSSASRPGRIRNRWSAFFTPARTTSYEREALVSQVSVAFSLKSNTTPFFPNNHACQQTCSQQASLTFGLEVIGKIKRQSWVHRRDLHEARTTHKFGIILICVKLREAPNWRVSFFPEKHAYTHISGRSVVDHLDGFPLERTHCQVSGAMCFFQWFPLGLPLVMLMLAFL